MYMCEWWPIAFNILWNHTYRHMTFISGSTIKVKGITIIHVLYTCFVYPIQSDWIPGWQILSQKVCESWRFLPVLAEMLPEGLEMVSRVKHRPYKPERLLWSRGSPCFARGWRIMSGLTIASCSLLPLCHYTYGQYDWFNLTSVWRIMMEYLTQRNDRFQTFIFIYHFWLVL